MIILLHGKDTYRSREKLNQIIERYENLHKDKLGLEYFDLDDDQNQGSSSGNVGIFQKFKNEINTISMFKQKKLIVLKNIFSDSDVKDLFLEFFKKKTESEDTVVFLEEKDINLKDSLLVFIKKTGKVQKFNLLKDEELRSWLRNEIKNKYSIKVDYTTENILIRSIGNDLWSFSNEIKKLDNFKKNDKDKTIKQSDIELLIKPKIDLNIFKTIEAIAQRDKKRALKLINQHLELGDNPLRLLSMITFQFRNLLIVKDLVIKNNTYSDIVKKIDLHPYVVKKTYYLVNKFSIEQLKDVFKQILETDLIIKTSKTKPKDALSDLILKI